jgi:hypothetical protein
VLVIVALLSWTAREIQNQKIPTGDSGAWITSDSDSLYHMRRLQRMLDEGGVWPAGRDAFLDYPNGSEIPWPPYYATVTRLLSGAPPAAEAERHGWIERRIASLPRWFGVLTSLVAALAAARLAGPGAGLTAGAVHALCIASIVYSRVGNGDHHAWISLLSGAMFWLTAEALRQGDSRRRAAALGVGAGALAGIALGSWVASILYVIPVQLALAWLLFRPRPPAALVPFGLAFHGAALALVLPAAATSPWSDSHPWIVVNLGWFHVVFLAVGALVFVPPLALSGARARSVYPWAVAGGLAALGLALLATGEGPGAGLREGFAWMRREDEFMGAVWESRGLFGRGSPFDPGQVLGWGILALPFAWLGAARLAFARGRGELLPWVIAVPLLAAQAARQTRFADALALPMAVLLGWGAATVWGAFVASSRLRRLRRAPPAVLGAAILLGVGLAHAGSVRRTVVGMSRDPAVPGQPEQPAALAVREMAAWIGAATVPADWSVLAPWTWGHAIEWGAGRPTVATNFGPFVGEEGFRTPTRFLLAEDPGVAERILEERRVRFVMLTTWMPNQLRHLIRAGAAGQESRWIEPGDDLRLKFAWYRTFGARLLHDGSALAEDGTREVPADFLRLVYATARTERRIRPEPMPIGLVWERVPGAILEAPGAPGDVLEVHLPVRYPRAGYELEWFGEGAVGEDGLARVRIPYATESPNGEGIATRPARWRIADRSGEVDIPERAVRERGTLRLQ